jgi:hypothetical protein
VFAVAILPVLASATRLVTLVIQQVTGNKSGKEDLVKLYLVLLVTCRSLTGQLVSHHISHCVKQVLDLFDMQTTNTTNANGSKSVLFKIIAQEKRETVMLSVLVVERTLTPLVILNRKNLL